MSDPIDPVKDTALPKGASESLAGGATSDPAGVPVPVVSKEDKAAAKAEAKRLKAEERAIAREKRKKRNKSLEPNPRWYAPLMVSLMVIGLIYIVVYYISGAQYPVPGITHWNLAIGFGIVLVGFGMTTGWK